MPRTRRKRKSNPKKKIQKQVKKGLYNFAIVASVNFVGTIVFTMLFHEVWHFDQKTSFALTLIVLFCINFLVFRYIVYKSKRTKIQEQFAHYFLATIAVRLLEYFFYRSLLNHGLDYRMAVILVTLSAVLVRFLLFKHAVFKR